MSWTDENYSDPQPPYGQAADNEIGWGQAADNAISWGKGHIMSLGHAVTNLFGNLASLQYELLFDSVNDYLQLNSPITLVGNFEFEYINNSNDLMYALVGTTSPYFIGSNSTNAYYRCGGGLETFTTAIPLGAKVGFKRTATTIDLYVNDVLIEARTISGANLVDDFVASRVNRVGVTYGAGALEKLRFKDATQDYSFLVNEGTGIVTRSEEDPTGVYFNIYGALWQEI